MRPLVGADADEEAAFPLPDRYATLFRLRRFPLGRNRSS
jgi:hypothetical protein